ncbi:hypothetical protein DM02DRAFT_670600 [Periconia macrospinosa]|uniref:F-box domain-containing protein n=1 Tax=Periconia macrospinosa TaxID=97972 RepID=A0A2V1DVU1_9PLEO|nr:hypothetical protein DM02DRAFT_670600 [Periconia macrospinosa]
MNDREFKLQLGISQEFPRKSSREFCGFSDGVEDCTCIKKGPDLKIEDCGFYGRPLEPLAFYLPPYSEVPQKQSQLYTIPKEIRDLIFEYALTDDGVPSFNCDNVFRRSTKGTIAKIDCACALLQTCKAVYLEAYRLPMLLNGYFAYRTKLYYGRHDGSRFNSPSRPDLGRIAPWQYALIQRIDLSLQQASIEERLQTEIHLWQPALRHSGAYGSPRYYNTLQSYAFRKPPEVTTHNFALVPVPIEYSKDIADGDKVKLHRWDVEMSEDPEHQEMGGKCQVWGKFTAAAMVARKLTRLTLRMSRTDWWTWTDDPNTVDNDKQLALDPACGGRKPRPLLHDMLALANARRDGHHPQYDEPREEPRGVPKALEHVRHLLDHTPERDGPRGGTWGAAIGALPDLETFELVLETFLPKKKQLETVVECAKTWRFPLKGTKYELVCDNKIKSMQWSMDIDDKANVMQTSDDHSSRPDDDFFPDVPWLRNCTDFEVRIVRFRRTRVDRSS